MYIYGLVSACLKIAVAVTVEGFQDKFSYRKISSVSFEAKQVNKTKPNLT